MENIDYFDDTLADILNIKKVNTIATELLIRSRRLNFSVVFITQSCFFFFVPEN